jgi:hypothetical protein
MIIYAVFGVEHTFCLRYRNANRNPFTASRTEVSSGRIDTMVLEPRFNGFNGIRVRCDEGIHFLLRQVLAISKERL